VHVFRPIAQQSVSVPGIVAVGALVGLVSGLFGVGGGFLLTPLLMFVGISPAVAAASGATGIIAGSAGGTLEHSRGGTVDYKMGLVLFLGGSVGGVIGVAILRWLNRFGPANAVIRVLYVVMLGLVGVMRLVEAVRVARRGAYLAERRFSPIQRRTWVDALPFRVRFAKSDVDTSFLVPVAMGGLAGVLAALMGVGGGFVMVPLMLYVLRMRMHLVAGTSLFQILLTGAARLLRGGETVWAGRAVGPVCLARTRADEELLPEGAILVVPQLLPDCVRLLPRVCGIIVERGTVTGHAASVVREFGVPCLVGVAGALDKLVGGQVVSLDAASGSVFAGAVWPELLGHLPVTMLGRRVVGLPPVLASKLTKLSGSSFVSSWTCHSLHDVIRFTHEMAIQQMFGIGDRLAGSAIGGVKRLETEEPVHLHVLDLGGGLRPEAAARHSVKPEEVVSVPFQGLWRGLADAAFVARRLKDPRAHAFASVVMSTAVAGTVRPLDAPNYACVTDSYLNLNSRQAYHFAVVDAFLADNENNNHVSLRLKGGGAAPWQRGLRAEFMAEVLRLHRFTATVQGDLLNGWRRGVDVATGLEDLTTLGHLLRCSAQLDMWMADENQVRRYVEAFVAAEAQAVAGRAAAAVPAPTPTPPG
jgi:uncharacterized membrane protein YfcA